MTDFKYKASMAIWSLLLRSLTQQQNCIFGQTDI